MDFLGDDFFCIRISAQCLVPLWIHVCVSLPASCIWQSLVRCRSSLRVLSSVFLGHGFQIFPYSAALGSTMDTCIASVYEAFGSISHVARRSLQWHVQGWFYWLRCTSRYFFLLCLQARDASHHGRYGPEGQFYARLSVAISQVQLLDEVVVPVVCSDICPLLTVPRRSVRHDVVWW